MRRKGLTMAMPALGARPWLRKITYLLAGGTMLVGTLHWLSQRTFTKRWIVARVDRILQDETGLSFAGTLDYSLLRGEVIIQDLALGGDLLKARRVELKVDLLSLLGRHPKLSRIHVEEPALILDKRRLDSIHLKPAPPPEVRTYLNLGTLRIHRGHVLVQEPLWGVPRTEASFEVDAHGTGDNAAEGNVLFPWIRSGEGRSERHGDLRFNAAKEKDGISIRDGRLRVEGSQATFLAHYAFAPARLEASLSASCNAAELASMAGVQPDLKPSGQFFVSGSAQGTLNALSWTAFLRSPQAGLPGMGLGPLQLEATADGNLREIHIKRLQASGPQGSLEASGAWRVGQGTQIKLDAKDVTLEPLAKQFHVPFLANTRVSIQGSATFPRDAASLRAITLNTACTFRNGSTQAGGFQLALRQGVLRADNLRLDMPECSLAGNVSASLGQRGVSALEGSLNLTTDAAVIAEVLGNWEIGDETKSPSGASVIEPFRMAGATTIQAQVRWTPDADFSLSGHCGVETPQWHGASADRMETGIRIQHGQLNLDGITLLKGEGRADGKLWLSFHKQPGEQDEIDMSFQASRLPVEEGLKAADLDLPISGLGSASVRIHGPYRRMKLLASATAENGMVYGMKIPAFAGDMDYDLKAGKLAVKDIRVANTLEKLAPGPLALTGSLQLDLGQKNLEATLQGSLDSASLELPIPHVQTRIDAKMDGSWQHPFASMQIPPFQLTFQQARVFLLDQTLVGLEGAAELKHNKLTARLGLTDFPAPLLALEAWQSGIGVRGTLNASLDPSTGNAPQLAALLSGGLLQNARLKLQAEGQWAPRGDVTWTGNLSEAWLAFDGFTMDVKTPALLQGQDGKVRGTLNLTGTQNFNPSFAGPLSEGASMKVEGSLPLTGTDRLDLNLAGQMDLGHFKSVLDHLLDVEPYSFIADLQPAGTTHFDLTLGGRYTDTTLDGTLALTNGRLASTALLQSVEDLAFNLRFKGKDIFLPADDPLRGTLAQGDLKAWGAATWGVGGITTYDIKTQIRDFQLRDVLEGSELAGTLDATLQGNTQGGLIQGALLADRISYRRDISLRNVLLSNALGGSNISSVSELDDPLTHIKLDLDLKLKQPWEFDTNLLKLQGQPVGSFKVMGTLANPGLKGKMEFLPGGRLTNLLPAGDVVLEHGAVEFRDPSVFNPNLDLLGRVDVPPYVVNLAISGNLDSLVMRPSSTPSLRQDEITSILIDPGLASSIASTSGPTAQGSSYGLANTSTGLLTTLALADFQDRLRRTLNLDRVSVAWRTVGAGNTETSVTVGKNLVWGSSRLPLVLSHRRTSDLVTLSGQAEWRLGGFVLQLGASKVGSASVTPSGEVRYTWSPK